jgi:hypothetical protein
MRVGDLRKAHQPQREFDRRPDMDARCTKSFVTGYSSAMERYAL